MAGNAAVWIPNSEVNSEFRRWIQDDFAHRMTPELSGFSANLFGLMTTGKFAGFAEAFGEFVLTQVPQRLFGGPEEVYQQYLYAYFQSASRAIDVTPGWTTMMEADAGVGRAGVVFYRNVGVVGGVKHIEHPKKGYRDTERLKLSRCIESVRYTALSFNFPQTHYNYLRIWPCISGTVLWSGSTHSAKGEWGVGYGQCQCLHG